MIGVEAVDNILFGAVSPCIGGLVCAPSLICDNAA
jgi:hypothetical protein